MHTITENYKHARIRNVQEYIDKLKIKPKWTKKYTAVKPYSMANGTGNIYFKISKSNLEDCPSSCGRMGLLSKRKKCL